MKDPQWLDLCGNNAATVFSLFFFFAKTSQSGLDGSISEDDRSILVANIWPLPKHLTWVMTCPEHIQKLPVVNQPGIILNLDALGVVGEVAVLGVGLGAASVADGGADHAVEAPERRLRPPEASQREHRRGRRSPARQRSSPGGAAAAWEARARGPHDEEDEHPYDGRGGGCHGVGRRSGIRDRGGA